MSNRKSADDRSNINKIYKPIAGYFGNAVKETGQYAKAVVKDILDADLAQNTPRHTSKGVVMGVKAKDNKAKAEFGQAVGAIVKGARYTPGGVQIKKTTADRNPKGLKKMDLDKKARKK
jgi:hypothetical protein